MFQNLQPMRLLCSSVVVLIAVAFTGIEAHGRDVTPEKQFVFSAKETKGIKIYISSTAFIPAYFNKLILLANINIPTFGKRIPSQQLMRALAVSTNGHPP